MCLQACQGFNRRFVLFIFRSIQERGRSCLASCGNRSGEGIHGRSIRGPDVVIPGCSLWGQFLHSQLDLKRRNPPRANTLQAYKRVVYEESKCCGIIQCCSTAMLCALVSITSTLKFIYLFRSPKVETVTDPEEISNRFLMIKIYTLINF